MPDSGGADWIGGLVPGWSGGVVEWWSGGVKQAGAADWIGGFLDSWIDGLAQGGSLHCWLVTSLQSAEGRGSWVEGSGSE